MTHQRAPVWAGALAALVAAAAGLAAGELVAAAGRGMRSPVVSVGDRVVDAAPPWLKDLAVDWFGTGDKAALITGTVVLLAAAAAAAGAAAARRHVGWAAAALAVLGGVGVLAAWRDRVGGPERLLPALATAAVAALVLAALLATAFRAGARPSPREPPVAPVMSGGDRRRFLALAGATALLAAATGAAGRWLNQQLDVARERAALVLPRPGRRLPPLPADPAREVEGLSRLVTPNADFFRIDTALVVPRVTVGGWALRVHGMVERELALTFDELLQRPIVEADVTLACVSNEVGGNLVGNARWAGVRLDDLLAEAGIDPDADQVVGRSVDGFTAGFPVAALDGRDALVAVEMNGEPLPVAHGYPARLVVPGLYGYVSATKWLTEIELTRFDRFRAYWVPRGWAAQAPIRTQSRIDVPRAGAALAPGTVAVAGVAWARTEGISAVEIQVDDRPWEEATLGPELAGTSWRQWWVDWEATHGEHRLRVRATDGEGDTQPEEPRPPRPDGATGWHTVAVTVA